MGAGRLLRRSGDITRAHPDFLRLGATPKGHRDEKAAGGGPGCVSDERCVGAVMVVTDRGKT